jgi:septum formation protein
MGISASRPPLLVLASQSAARISLLERAAIAFMAEASAVDERAVEAPLLAKGVSPADLASALAEAKALDVSARHPEALVIGGDQTLELDGERFTKPESVAAARRQLARLAGHSHRLHSAVAVARDGDVIWRHRASATMTMRALDLPAIDAYLAVVGDRVMGSVGAYQLEGPGVRLFEKIEGDFFVILGLPLLPLLAYLREAGAIAW